MRRERSAVAKLLIELFVACTSTVKLERKVVLGAFLVNYLPVSATLEIENLLEPQLLPLRQREELFQIASN